MKKEVLIAIVTGFGLGLLITYGVYRVRLAMTRKPPTIEEIVSTTPSPTDEADGQLALHSPVDGTIQTETTTTITGTTIPDSYVVIFVNDEDFITTSDGSGNFSLEAELTAGSNVIATHVVNQEGTTFSKERVVIVTDLYSEDTAASTEDGEEDETTTTDDQQ